MRVLLAVSLVGLGAIAYAAAGCGGSDGSSAANDGGATGDGASGSDGGGGGGDDGGGGGVGDDGGDAGQGDGTPWRYAIETAPSGVNSVVTLARAPSGLAAAFAMAGGDLSVATRNGASWTSDTATGNPLPGDARFVVAADGTPWIVSGGGGSDVKIAHKEASWIVDTVTGTFSHVALAVAPDGTPWIAASGYAPSVTNGVLVVKRNGASWTVENAATPPSGKIVTDVALAVSGGVPQIAWIAQDGSVHLTTPANGGGYADAVVGSGQYNGGIAAVTDKDDKLHLAYQANGRSPTLFTNVSGSWQGEMVTTEIDSKGLMRLTAAPDGSLALAWYSNTYGVRVAVRAPAGGWSTQSVFAYCADPSRISIAYDAASSLYVAHNCESPGAIWRRNTPFPADYVPTCKTVASALCQKAYACCASQSSQTCCISTTQGGTNCSNPESYCETAVARDVCANATQDPAVVSACNAATGQAACTTTPKPGATSPDACAQFF